MDALFLSFIWNSQITSIRHRKSCETPPEYFFLFTNTHQLNQDFVFLVDETGLFHANQVNAVAANVMDPFFARPSAVIISSV